MNLEKIVLADLEHELSGTRRMLERIPDDHLAWKPHEKSFTLGELARHVSNLVYWQVTILRDEAFDLQAAPAPLGALPNREALLEEFDRSREELESALAKVDPDHLSKDWTLRNGEHIVATQPRLVALRLFGVNHLVHHRGQLGVYLRLLEVPVPGLYGPSADEKGG